MQGKNKNHSADFGKNLKAFAVTFDEKFKNIDTQGDIVFMKKPRLYPIRQNIWCAQYTKPCSLNLWLKLTSNLLMVLDLINYGEIDPVRSSLMLQFKIKKLTTSREWGFCNVKQGHKSGHIYFQGFFPEK